MYNDDICIDCDGTGIGDPHTDSNCTACGGSGVYFVPRRSFIYNRDRYRNLSEIFRHNKHVPSIYLTFDEDGTPRLPTGWQTLPQDIKDDLWRQYRTASQKTYVANDLKEQRRIKAAIKWAGTPK